MRAGSRNIEPRSLSCLLSCLLESGLRRFSFNSSTQVAVTIQTCCRVSAPARCTCRGTVLTDAPLPMRRILLIVSGSIIVVVMSVVVVHRISARFIAFISVIDTLSIGVVDIDLSVSIAIIIDLVLVELHIASRVNDLRIVHRLATVSPSVLIPGNVDTTCK